MKQCPKCNAVHNKPGIFCSRPCANSRTWTAEVNLKRSESLKLVSPWNTGLTTGVNESRNAAIKAARIEQGRKKFLSGLLVERSAIRKHLASEHGYCCVI